MPRTTTNKSLRPDESRKATRRRSVGEGETDEQNRAAGASGESPHPPKRPGRAASLLSTTHRMRSQRWRNPEKGGGKLRRGVLAKGSRTGRKQAK
jgi:hypothetical protein